MLETQFKPPVSLFLSHLNSGFSPDESLSKTQAEGYPFFTKEGMLIHLHTQLDALTLSHLSSLHIEKVRAKIYAALWTRLQILTPYKKAVQKLVVCGLVPLNTPLAVKRLWKTCDVLWYWAGDQSTDFNHYTKRGLMMSILISSTLYWLQDRSPEHLLTQKFIQKAIDKTMKIQHIKNKAVHILQSPPLFCKFLFKDNTKG